MPEDSSKPEPRTRTTEEAKPRKIKNRRPRIRITEEVYEPRTWVWAFTVCVFLQLVGFLTCQPPSRGWYYRQCLSTYLSNSVQPLVAKCRQSVTSFVSCLWYRSWILIDHNIWMVLKHRTLSQRGNVQADSLPWMSYLCSFRDGFSNCFLYLISALHNGWSLAITLVSDAPETLPRLAREYFTDFLSLTASLRESTSARWDQIITVLAHYLWLAIFDPVVILDVLAFWKRSGLKRQSMRAGLALMIFIKKPRVQGMRAGPALMTFIKKPRVQGIRAGLAPKNIINKTRAWGTRIIFAGTAVLCILFLYWLIFADHEAFWAWSDGAR